MSRIVIRDLAVFVAICIVYCVAFLVEPDWNLQEAHRFCSGQPVQIFESMSARALNMPPACTICARPRNPWVIVYWLVLLPATGVAAAFLLRARPLLGTVVLAGALAVGGYCGLLILSRRELFEPEAWVYAPYVIAAHAAIVVIAFWLARLATHLVVKRRLETPSGAR